MSPGEAQDLEAFESGQAAVLAVEAVDISGVEAASYLQGQLTQDVTQIEVGGGAWSFLLEPDGKVVSLLRVVRTGPERFLLIGGPDSGPIIEQRLRRFMIRVKAVVELTPAWVFCVIGESAPDFEDGSTFEMPTTSESVHDFLVLATPSAGSLQGAPAAKAVSTWTAVHGVLLSSDVAAGSSPFECGPEILRSAVSFTKGCYTGQELIARVDARGGTAPFRLLGIEGSSGLAPGVELESEGAVVGTVVRVGSGLDMMTRGLARIARKVQAGSVVHIVDNAESAVVFDLPSQRFS